MGDLYLFHFIVPLSPNFNCSKGFVSFSFDKVTTETYIFVFVISNVNSTGATIAGLLLSASFAVISTKTQFFDQVKINSTSQLISGVFKLFQKLLKCFSEITTSDSFLPTLFAFSLGLSTSLPSSSVIFSSALQVFP